jgi:hypothetical protein
MINHYANLTTMSLRGYEAIANYALALMHWRRLPRCARNDSWDVSFPSAFGAENCGKVSTRGTRAPAEGQHLGLIFIFNR